MVHKTCLNKIHSLLFPIYIKDLYNNQQKKQKKDERSIKYESMWNIK